MAVISKKDKLIEEAQKLVSRALFDKAAKVYEQILELEPAAINHRQKLAELLIKCGRHDDARKQFETIGKHYSKNGFYLKAIAVYKQLQKLFPSDISLTMTLAELNEKHGLVANSLSEYKIVYDFHEKAGNIPESLNILDRMQNVDPQNVPIKIKLADAFIQQGKMAESYSVFAKTALLLIERRDNATLSKVFSRIQQLFPDKPDFMIEILGEQLKQGSVSSAIDTIQGLLRSNPNNKPAWDLIVNAYQLLGQPQRVKVACQHYLKFFPSEPAAMYGLISSSTAEKNLAVTLELLDQYEDELISAGYLQQLEETYLALDKLDPINIRVLEGHVRVATATGDKSEVISLTSKLQSLRSVSGGATAQEPPPAILAESPFGDFEFESSDQTSFVESFSDQMPASAFEISEIAAEETTVSNPVTFDATVDLLQQPEEDIEIDIEIDLDSPFGTLESEADTTIAHDKWLASVGDLFDTISTAPRGVKFGNEMDSSDAQSHFDLGQAFKEMGLFDEAINEFRQASQETSRRVECLLMQCACLRERGEVEKAISMLQALLKPGLNEEESCAIKYELAIGYETIGKMDEASVILNEINSVNPEFRDVSSRLDVSNAKNTLDFSDEDLNDFGLK
jgi:tetratricopeptide (TPR) repeat protein